MISDNVKAGWVKSCDKQRANPDDVKAKFIEVHGDYYDCGKNILKSGNTELITIDIGGLDEYNS